MRNSDTPISNVEKNFILKALKDENRIDGRKPFDFRKPVFKFTLDDSSATVQLGETRVITVVSLELEPPFPDRPNEGFLRFNVEFSPMASPAFEPGRPTPEAVTLTRLVERSLRQSGAVDQEALCVAAGRKVWALRVDVHVLDHGGNLVDACCLSALAGLMVCRKPEVTFGGASGTEIIVHPPEVKEPSHLMIHHLPVAVSFGLFEDGELVVVDPSVKEEAAMAGLLTVVMNQHHELCAVHKAEGIGLSRSQIMRCMRIATGKVDEVVQKLREALDVHEVARVQARVRRHHVGTAAEGSAPLGLPGRLSSPQQPTGTTGAAALAAEVSAMEADIDAAIHDAEAEEEEEEESSDDGEAEEVVAAMEAAASGTPARDGSKSAGTAPPRAGPKLGGTLASPEPSSSQPQRPVTGLAQKRSKAPAFTSPEQIAAMLAGTNDASMEDVPDLAAAVKRNKKSRQLQQTSQKG